ncbi:MAG: GGDEF domain-containing protein [Bacilli bacterium]|nr:GGDEF domain-containing protein [Bacilli bacterium]
MINENDNTIEPIINSKKIMDEIGNHTVYSDFYMALSKAIDFEYKAPFARFRILDKLTEKRVVTVKSEAGNWYECILFPNGEKKALLLIEEVNPVYATFLKEGQKKIENTNAVIHDLFKHNFAFAFIVYPKTDKVIYYVFNGEKELVEVKEDRKWSRAYGDYVATLHPDDRQYFYEATHYGDFSEMKEGDSIDVVFRSTILHNRYRWYRGLITARVVKNEKHDPELGVINLVSDITNEISEKERLQTKSETDALTGLYNRTHMDDRIEAWQNSEDPCTVIFMDINGLKQTNDTMGHEEGDRLIKGVTSGMKVFSDEGFEVYRYGGDEFLALAEKKEKEEVEALIKSYLDILRETGFENRVAYGVISDRPKKELRLMIHDADSEMYKCKKCMKGNKIG